MGEGVVAERGRPHERWSEHEQHADDFGSFSQLVRQPPRDARDREDERDRDDTEGRGRGLQRERRRSRTYDDETERGDRDGAELA